MYFAVGKEGAAARQNVREETAAQALAHALPGEIVAPHPTGDDQPAFGAWIIGGAVTFPPPTLEQAKADKLRALAAIANVRLNLWTGDAAPAGGLQVDDVSTGRITSWAAGALVAQTTGVPFGLPFWIMADNSHRPVTSATDFIEFAQAALNYKTAAVLRNSVLKAAIDAAADAATLAAIDLTAGWPA